MVKGKTCELFPREVDKNMSKSTSIEQRNLENYTISFQALYPGYFMDDNNGRSSDYKGSDL